MGYSKSKKAVRKVQPFLDKLVVAESNITFPSRNPKKLAYSLHNAIHAAQFFPDTQQYARIKLKYEISFTAQTVHCLIKETLAALKSQMEDMIHISDIVEPLGVIGAAIKHKATVMHFPDYPGAQNLAIIENWAKKNAYSVITNEEGITLIKEGFDASLTT